jgi:hypothetical protein
MTRDCRTDRARWVKALEVPGSGTGEVTGLSGTMTIRVEDEVHRDHFDYALPRR